MRPNRGQLLESEGMKPSVALAASSVSVLALVGGILLLTLPLLVRRLGGLPPEKSGSSQKDASPSTALLAVTAAVCIGVMANITAILTTVQYETAVLTISGYIIASDALGAIVGLLLFRQLSIQRLKTAYQLSACSMVLGNGLYAVSVRYAFGVWALVASRVVTGLGAGSMYNSAMAIVHFARGSKKTSYMVLYQFFIAVGVLLGPSLASVALALAPNQPDSTKDALASLTMSAYGVGLWAAVRIFLPDFAEMEREAGICQEDSATPGGKTDEDAASVSRGAALFMTLCASAFTRLAQRLLWEAGAVIAVQQAYGWSPVAAGGMYTFVVACQAVSQLAFSTMIAGKFSDQTLMRCLEVSQIVGALLMFQPWSLSQDFGIFQFLMASVLSYCSNALWSGVVSSYCVKRTLDEGSFNTENLMLVNQAAIMLGIGFGSVMSRAVEELLPGINGLALPLLAGSVCQLNLSVFAMGGTSLDFFVIPLALALGTAIAAGSLLVSLGGTGASNIFSWHVVSMGLAWPLCAVLGYWSYNADALELWQKHDKRSLHMIMMVCTGVLSAAGYYAIFRAHSQNGEGQLGGLVVEGGSLKLERSWARFAHVVVGYVVLLGAAVQISVGVWKRRMLSFQVKVAAWHGRFGLFLLLASLVAVGIGSWIDFNGAGGWPLALQILLTIGVGALAGVFCV
mmetsp:Transcript_1553/g.3932  ORF Transcript_1553/g.3932 Transcript_1553/m.3932 type:complete len:683 (+) Transcript_1553:1-2049(+)